MPRVHSLLTALVASALVTSAAAFVAAPALANGIIVADGVTGRRGGPPVRLDAHKVTAKIHDRVAEVTVEQTFHSDADRQLEGTYLFPLPAGAAVRQFAMTMGGKMVVGEVVEAKQARAVYEGIVARKKDPGLLEWAGSGLFRARVFPIEPNADLTIRLEFQEVLAEDAGTLAWRYPLATDRLNGAPVSSVLVDVSIESTVDLKAVYCPSHQASVVRDGERKARVTHERAGRMQDRDFLLYVGRSPEDVGFSLVSGKAVAEDGTFMAVLAPRVQAAEGKRIPKEMVYVLDTSGSMQGEKLEQARAALTYGVRMLREGDRFAIVAFSTGVRSFREGLVPVTKETQEAAVQWIGGLAAEGGTNIDGALAEALKLRSTDRLPIVVFLTDGEPTVGETRPDVLEKNVAASNASKSRIFTFGVGTDLNVRLLDLIAEKSGGTRDYVGAKENIEIVTSRFFRKVDTPVLTDVTVDLGGGVSDVYPTRIPDLFAGEQLVLFGRYAASGERAVTLRGRVGETAVTFTYPANLADTPGPDFLPRIWAHRKVAFLLDEIRLHGANKELVDEVIRLATRFAIVTPYTSALVVEDGERGPRPLASGERPPTPEETEQVHPEDVVARGPTVKDAELSDHNETDSDLPTEESLGEGGVSDAPFEGPSNNGLLGLGGAAGGSFQGRGGHRNLRAGGGGRKLDDGIEDALKWLAAHQSPDGGWQAKDFGGWCDGRPSVGSVVPGVGRAEREVAVTGLSLLAFLGTGYTNRSEGTFGRVIGNGLKYLRNAQDAEGCFGPRTHDGWLEDHAIAATAMVEAFGMTGASIYKSPAQKALDFLANVRPPSSVWSRGSADGGSTGAGDATTTAWASLCLADVRRMNAAEGRAGRSPMLEGYDRRREETLAWLAKASEAGDAIAGASALFLALERPQAARDVESVRAAERLFAALSPSIDVAALDLGRGHWATIALFQAGGEVWKRWDPRFVRRVVDAQRHDGDFCTTKGSFDPSGAEAEAFGRVGSTALGALSLEVHHRYDRGGVAQTPAASPSVPARAPSPRPTPVVPGAAPAPPPPPTDATGESVDLQKRKDASTAPVDGQKVRSISGRTFRVDAAGRYVDTAFDPKATLERVEAYSPAYFALAAISDEVARILSLGDRIVFGVGARWIEVVPVAAPNPVVR